jgi:hypothetical protein
MILDADVLIDLLRAVPQARSWLRGLSILPAISGMAALEVLYGAANTAELSKAQAYIRPFPILWPSEADAEATSRLAPYRLSDGMDLIDAMTSAIALRNNMPLATFNIKHFRSIPGLSTIQPDAGIPRDGREAWAYVRCRCVPH